MKKKYKVTTWILTACLLFCVGLMTNTVNAQAAPKTKTYKVIYRLNGGKNHKANAKRIKKDKSLKLKNPTRNGYVFKGWYKDKKYTKRVTRVKGVKKSKDRTVYAKWVKVEAIVPQHIHKDANGNDLGKVPWCGICNGTGINTAPKDDPVNPDGSKNIYPL